MFRYFLPLLTTFLMVFFQPMLHAQSQGTNPGTPPDVGFAIIKTSQVAVVEALLVPGGSITRQVDSNFSAFLIKHHDDYLLFDTGMGTQIDAQYQQGHAPVVAAIFQVRQAGGQRAVAAGQGGHAASQTGDPEPQPLGPRGWPDGLPEARVGVAAAELALLRNPTTGPGGTWASQISAATIQWETLAFQARPVQGLPAKPGRVPGWKSRTGTHARAHAGFGRPLCHYGFRNGVFLHWRCRLDGGSAAAGQTQVLGGRQTGGWRGAADAKRAGKSTCPDAG